MAYVTLYFFDQNVIISKSHTSWEEACEIINQHIIFRLEEYDFAEEISIFDLNKQKEFVLTKNKIPLFKKETNPAIVCDMLIECLECLDICSFQRKVMVGNNFLLKGMVGNKNFLIEISEE